jgi:hypothetical protein
MAAVPAVQQLLLNYSRCVRAVWMVPIPQHELLALHLREAPDPVRLQPGHPAPHRTCPLM